MWSMLTLQFTRQAQIKRVYIDTNATSPSALSGTLISANEIAPPKLNTF